MYSIKLDGFVSKKQAEEFVYWLSGQGEQDAIYWFEEAGVPGFGVDWSKRPKWNEEVFEALIK